MSTPTPQQKRFQLDAAHNAVRRICETWPVALDAARSFGQESIGENVGSSSKVANPTMHAGLQTDVAAKWIRDVRNVIRAPDPMASHLHRVVDALVQHWPSGTTHFLDSLVALANRGVREWPPQPRFGEVVDGVKVGSRGDQLEYCTECRQPVTGDAADPISRIDGKPFHRKPCYQTVWQRNDRARRRLERAE
jgi:hypothetical protein